LRELSEEHFTKKKKFHRSEFFRNVYETVRLSVNYHDAMWFRSDSLKYFDIKHIAVSRICWSV